MRLGHSSGMAGYCLHRTASWRAKYSSHAKSPSEFSLDVLMRDIDIFGDDNYGLQGRISNYLSWMQTSGYDRKSEDTRQANFTENSQDIQKSDPLSLLRGNMPLRYQIHGFLNAVTTQQITFDRLDAVQILAYLLAYDDSFSVGERLIRIVRSHEQLTRSMHLFSLEEKNAIIYRMLQLSTQVFHIGVLASLVEHFFQCKENRKALNLNVKSIEYQHLSMARSILHLMAIKGARLDFRILKLLLRAYRNHLATYLRSDHGSRQKIIVIPITEFIVGLEAALGAPHGLSAPTSGAISASASFRTLESVDVPCLVLEIFVLQLHLRLSSLADGISDSNRLFYDEISSRIRRKSCVFEHLRSRLCVQAPQILFELDPSFDRQQAFLYHRALEFSTGTVPFRSWMVFLHKKHDANFRAKDGHSDDVSVDGTTTCEHILACSRLGFRALSEISDSEVRELIFLILGPKIRPPSSSAMAVYPLLDILWTKDTLVPLAQSLMNAIAGDVRKSDTQLRALRGWLVLKVLQFSLETLTNSGPNARYRQKSAQSSIEPSVMLTGPSSSGSKLDVLVTWFRRSSLYEGPVSSIPRLQTEKFAVDKFIFSLFTIGGTYLSFVSSILNLSMAKSMRSSANFLYLLDAHAWIATISLLWERKRYNPIVDFYRLFIETDNNNNSAFWLPQGGKYLAREHLSEAEITEIEDGPSTAFSHNGVRDVNARPSVLFDDLFLDPLIKAHEEEGDPCEHLVAVDNMSGQTIDSSQWILSRSYRIHHVMRLLDILIMAMVIKSEWQLLLGLLYRIKETLPRAIPVSKIVNRLRSHIPFILQNLCGGFILNDQSHLETRHPKDRDFQAKPERTKYNPNRTVHLQGEYGTRIEFFPREQPQFPHRPYLVVQIEQTRVPCTLPCLPDHMSMSQFGNLLPLIQWGPYKRSRQFDPGSLATRIPEYVKDVGALRSYLKSDTTVFSADEIQALRLVLFTVHIKPGSTDHNRNGADGINLLDHDGNRVKERIFRWQR